MATSFFRSAVTLLLHALVWGLVVVLLVAQQPDYPGPKPDEFWLKQGVVFGLLAALFYLNSGWAAPRLFYRRQVLAWLTLNAVAVVGILAVHQQVELRLGVPEKVARAREAALNPPNPWCAPRPRLQPGPEEAGGGFFNPGVLLLALMVLGLAASVTAVQRAQREAEARLLVEQQKTATELSLLKAQINPHFFFNTLNNIYALTILDGEKARAALHRLSRMMRYVLYEAPAAARPLSQEVAFLRDYIDLMQLRLTDKVRVTFEAPNPPIPDLLMAPMLFQPYVENAFKHGVSALTPSQITVLVRQPQPDTIELTVRNTCFPSPAERAAHDPEALEAGGIGLVNTQRRLDLLYPSRHTLRVTDCTPETEYEVCLTLSRLL